MGAPIQTTVLEGQIIFWTEIDKTLTENYGYSRP